MSRIWRAFVSASFACAIILRASVPAAAAPLGAEIQVERAPSAGDCPSAAQLNAEVERILQRSLSGAPSAQDALQVNVSFTSNGDEYAAQVRSLGAKPGERVLRDRGHHCEALAQAVSVTIALLLDKELARLRPEAAPAPPALAAPKATSPAHTGGVVDTADTTRAARLALRESVEGGYAAGLVGPGSMLLSEQIGVRLRHWTFDAGFNAALPDTTHFAAGSVRSTLLFASLRGCYSWGERFSFGPCALLGLGRLRGVGIGYAQAQSQDLLWTAAGVGLVAEGPLWGRVFWGLSGQAWWPTRRSSFSVQNVGTAWESGTFAGALSARLGFRIW